MSDWGQGLFTVNECVVLEFHWFVHVCCLTGSSITTQSLQKHHHYCYLCFSVCKVIFCIDLSKIKSWFLSIVLYYQYNDIFDNHYASRGSEIIKQNSSKPWNNGHLTEYRYSQFMHRNFKFTCFMIWGGGGSERRHNWGKHLLWNSLKHWLFWDCYLGWHGLFDGQPALLLILQVVLL